MTERTGITCQDCGDTVHLEVSWEHWGVDRLYFECRGCGRSGWTEPRLSFRTDD